jgi:hypothetical protein
MEDLPAALPNVIESSGLKERIEATAAAKEASKAALKLVEKSVAIKEDPLGDPAYLARFLIQCTLPHTNPGDVPVWKRRNGKYTLRVQPGWDERNNRPMGYPYGIMPRLILIWVVTEAKRTGIRRLHLGHCMTEFIEKLDLDKPTGRGKRGTPMRIKEQASRLFSAHIDFFQHTREFVDGKTILTDDSESYRVASKIHLRWNEKDENQAVLWGSYIDLSRDFFAAIMESVVPCDMRAVAMLRKSPLALDLYMLCNYIGANLKQRKKTKHLLTWRMLGQQLGCDYSDQHDLKRKIKKAMLLVKSAHPELKFGYLPQGGGMEIHVSKPAIAPRTEKVDLG